MNEEINAKSSCQSTQKYCKEKEEEKKKKKKRKRKRRIKEKEEEKKKGNYKVIVVNAQIQTNNLINVI